MTLAIVISVIVLILVIVVFATGIGFKTKADSVFFGYRKYTFEQIQQCDFFISTFHHYRGGWKVRVDVYENKKYLRTHVLDAVSKKSAEKKAKEIQDSIESCKMEN